MKFKFLLFPVLFSLLVLSTSCLKTDDTSATYTDWKLKNEAYFTNMKDSAGFDLYSIPANRGGGSFYYHIIDSGDVNSASPLFTDTVYVHYQGRTMDWKLFDGTYAGAEPIFNHNEDSTHFKVNGVIKGWTEALMQMKVGEKRRVVIPWNLAYGASGYNNILPYSTLIFDVKLISFGTPKNQ